MSLLLTLKDMTELSERIVNTLWKNKCNNNVDEVNSAVTEWMNKNHWELCQCKCWLCVKIIYCYEFYLIVSHFTVAIQTAYLATI